MRGAARIRRKPRLPMAFVTSLYPREPDTYTDMASSVVAPTVATRNALEGEFSFMQSHSVRHAVR